MAKSKFDVPSWVPRLEWEEFVLMRKKIRHPLTDFACELIVGDLEKFKQQGYEPGLVLRESIKNGWRGVFIPNGHSQHGGNPTTPALTKTIACNFCQRRFASGDFSKHRCAEEGQFMEQQALKQRVAK